jgi:hypothetical protein
MSLLTFVFIILLPCRAMCLGSMDAITLFDAVFFSMIYEI